MRHSTLMFSVVVLSGVGCGENATFTDGLQPYGHPPVQPLTCMPNLDGMITAAESSPVMDAAVSFRVSPYVPLNGTPVRTVDTAGVIDSDGHRVWDWSSTNDNPPDEVADLWSENLQNQWFADSFPSGEFVAPLDAAGTLVGVYSFDETSLKLYGTASTEENPTDGKILLVYDNPVELFRFPMQVGKNWTQHAEVHGGTFHNVPWSQEQDYEISVVAAGQLKLPYYGFSQALRVNTKVVTTLATGSTTKYGTRQTLFLFECFATDVARAQSPQFEITDTSNDDPGPDFTVAQEVRRLGWL